MKQHFIKTLLFACLLVAGIASASAQTGSRTTSGPLPLPYVAPIGTVDYTDTAQIADQAGAIGWQAFGNAGLGLKMYDVMSDKGSGGDFIGMVLGLMALGSMDAPEPEGSENIGKMLTTDSIKLPFYMVGPRSIVALASPTDCRYDITGARIGVGMSGIADALYSKQKTQDTTIVKVTRVDPLTEEEYQADSMVITQRQTPITIYSTVKIDDKWTIDHWTPKADFPQHTEQVTGGSITYIHKPVPLVFVLPEIENPSNATMSFCAAYCDYDMRTPVGPFAGAGVISPFDLESGGDVRVGYIPNYTGQAADTARFVEIPGVPDKVQYFDLFAFKTLATMFMCGGMPDLAHLQRVAVNLGVIPDGARLAIKIPPYHPFYYNDGQGHNNGDATPLVSDFHFHAIAINDIAIDRTDRNGASYAVNTDFQPVTTETNNVTLPCTGQDDNGNTISTLPLAVNTSTYDIEAQLESIDVHMLNKDRQISLTDDANTTAITQWVAVSRELAIPEKLTIGPNPINIAPISSDVLSGLSGSCCIRVPRGVKFGDTDDTQPNTSFATIDHLVLLFNTIPTADQFPGTRTGITKQGAQLTFGLLDYEASLSDFRTAIRSIFPAAQDTACHYASYPYAVIGEGFDVDNVEITQRPFRDIHLKVQLKEGYADQPQTTVNAQDGTKHVVSAGITFMAQGSIVDDHDSQAGHFEGHLTHGEGEVIVTGHTYALIENADQIALTTYEGYDIFNEMDSLVIDCDKYTAGGQWEVQNLTGNNSGYLTTTTDIHIRHRIDSRRYYWISQPFDVRLGDVVAKDADGHVVGLWNQHPRNADHSKTWWVIYRYDESQRTTGQLNSYIQISDPDYILRANQGYAVTAVQTQAVANQGGSVDVTLMLPSGRGRKVLGSNSYNGYTIDGATKTGDNWWSGWNLMGNPFLGSIPGSAYSKYINLDLGNDAKEVNQVCTYIENVTLPPFIGLSVQVADASPITITRQQNSAQAPAQKPEHFAIRLSRGNSSDRTTVIANSDATTDYVIGEDLSKVTGNNINIYTIDSGIRYAFNERPIDHIDSTRISLGVNVRTSGTYTFAIDGNMTDFEGQVILHDMQQGTYSNLTLGDATRELTPGTADSRFEIIVTRKPVGVEQVGEDAQLSLYVTDGRLMTDTNLEGAELTIYDAQGRTLHSERVNGTVDYQLPVRGVYMITVRQNDSKSTIKVVY